MMLWNANLSVLGDVGLGVCLYWQGAFQSEGVVPSRVSIRTIGVCEALLCMMLDETELESSEVELFNDPEELDLLML
jgi:hypothetical protein